METSVCVQQRVGAWGLKRALYTQRSRAASCCEKHAPRGELSRHFRIFDWEAVRPTAVYRKLVSEEATPFLSLAVDLMRRFMPTADQRTLTMAAIWLIGQRTVFVRNRERLTSPPVSLDLGDAAVEQLTTLISSWALAGLTVADCKSARATLVPAISGK